MWKRNVWLYYFWSFFNSFTVVGAILVPFFKAKGLNQLEIQSLQAFFQIAVFLLEVPTGVVADKWGRKVSLVIGGILGSFGLGLYALVSRWSGFLGCEFLLALAMALKSGSDQALIYDSLKENEKEERFAKVVSVARSLSLAGIGVGAISGSWLTRWLSLNQIVGLNGLVWLVSGVVGLGWREPEIKSESEVRHWKIILRQGWEIVRKERKVKWLIIEGAWLYSLGYFVIWLYQVKLQEIGISIYYFGWFHAALVMLQVIWLGVWRRIWRRFKRETVLKWMPVLVGLGYMVVGGEKSWVGVLIWFGLSGVLGLTSREILVIEMQDRLKSEVRATVISFAGMMRSLVIAAMNPIVGWLVDWDLKIALVGLGAIGLVGYWVGKKTAEVVGFEPTGPVKGAD